MLGGVSRLRPTTLLGATVLGVYLLVVVGATASLAEAAEACSSWPGCSGSLDDPTVLVALGHRLTAALVGLLVVLTAVVVYRTETTTRVRAATAAAFVLYPGQVAVGALVTTGTAAPGGLHLLLGLVIFGALVLALAWHLEDVTGTADETVALTDETLGSTDETLEPADPPTEHDDTPETDQPVSTAAAPTPLSERSLATQLRARAWSYFQLMKPRLMWLLSLVAAAAMALAAGSASLSISTIVLTLGGGVLAIGASGTFNHVLERDRDKKMSRTNDRPLVTHEVPARNAMLFGVILTVLSIAVFLQVNALTAALGFVAILFYTVIYTLVLKPNTVQNTVLGGAAGSLPALIGWAAVTGRIGVAGIVLAGLIFVWTPAHFYNLALAYKDDYARGGFPMMPVVRGETTTRKHILLWLGATLAATTALIWLTTLGWLTALTTTLVGGLFLWTVVRLHHEQTEAAAFRAFHASNAYLGLVLVAIVVDVLAF